jgi:hypothetical protein
VIRDLLLAVANWLLAVAACLMVLAAGEVDARRTRRANRRRDTQ